MGLYQAVVEIPWLPSDGSFPHHTDSANLLTVLHAELQLPVLETNSSLPAPPTINRQQVANPQQVGMLQPYSQRTIRFIAADPPV